MCEYGHISVAIRKDVKKFRTMGTNAFFAFQASSWNCMFVNSENVIADTIQEDTDSDRNYRIVRSSEGRTKGRINSRRMLLGVHTTDLSLGI